MEFKGMAKSIIIPVKRAPSSDDRQYMLDGIVDKAAEIDGVGMGVLSDGTPFLNQRGLAILCGVKNAHIGTISSQWSITPLKPRLEKIKGIMDGALEFPNAPHFETKFRGRRQFCYPANVCLAILEYYAFEAGVQCQDEARHNFRRLAGSKLQDLIYKEVGYSAANNNNDRLSSWLARVELNRQMAPDGYFSVFNESHTVVYELERAGARPGAKLVPDISIGSIWRKHWESQGLEAKFGMSFKCVHNYPDDHPQSKSNPQQTWCYPDSCLPEF